MAAKTTKTPQEALRARIAARRQARKTEKVSKYAKMQQTAQKAPEKLEKLFRSIAVTANKMAYGFENLMDHCDLVRAPKGASSAVRIAAAKNYGVGLKKLAEEQPDMLETALQEAYKALDEQAAAMEIAAEALGIDLGATPTEQAFTDEGKHELEMGEEKGEEVAEEEGPSFEAKEEEVVEEAAPETPSFEKGDEEEAKEGSGSDAYVDDRDHSGQPRTPGKLDIPQAQGEAEGNKRGNKRGAEQEPTKQEYSISEVKKPAGDFVADIPQSQGSSEVNKQSGVMDGEPAPSFVKDIPQAQGESEVNKMSSKIGAVLTSIIKKAMSRKDYIMIADAIKETPMAPEAREAFARRISQPLLQDNPRFDEETFVNYVMGTGGPRKKRQPQQTPPGAM
jgi:hypothetical protein